VTKQDRRQATYGIPLLVGAALVLVTVALLFLVPLFSCPACTTPWEPGTVLTVTHTGPCEFCDGTERVTLRGWRNAREWHSRAFVKP
jgi:hypothetical protein